MSNALAALLASRLARNHAQLLKVTEELSDEQLGLQPGPTAPSIRFHLWHISRWSDRHQAFLFELTDEAGTKDSEGRELWELEGLPARWGLPAGNLGEGQTGMGLDDDASASLPLPGKNALLDYARRALTLVEQAVEKLDERMLEERCTDPHGHPNVVADVVISHLMHVNRHLGMIEALRGVQGLHGTATR